MTISLRVHTEDKLIDQTNGDFTNNITFWSYQIDHEMGNYYFLGKVNYFQITESLWYIINGIVQAGLFFEATELMFVAAEGWENVISGGGYGWWCEPRFTKTIPRTHGSHHVKWSCRSLVPLIRPIAQPTHNANVYERNFLGCKEDSDYNQIETIKTHINYLNQWKSCFYKLRKKTKTLQRRTISAEMLTWFKIFIMFFIIPRTIWQ